MSEPRLLFSLCVEFQMEDDTGERSSIVIGLIENRAKEVFYPLFISLYDHIYRIYLFGNIPDAEFMSLYRIFH